MTWPGNCRRRVGSSTGGREKLQARHWKCLFSHDSFHKDLLPFTAYTKHEAHVAHPNSGITCRPSGGSGNYALGCCFAEGGNQHFHRPLERSNGEDALLLRKRGRPSAAHWSTSVQPCLLSSNNKNKFQKAWRRKSFSLDMCSLWHSNL